MDQVYLKCIKEGSKLRVKIISPGFHSEANCQFPKNIREEGRKYSVPLSSVSFSEGPNHKFFYRINKSHIKIISEIEGSLEDPVSSETIKKIFEDNSILECMICMDKNKEIVFAKCGHYVCCEDCSLKIFKTTKKCPICRSKIDSVVRREFIQI
jgi:predicted DNA-binding antitoxin AbrB/MazE fold protein